MWQIPADAEPMVTDDDDADDDKHAGRDMFITFVSPRHAAAAVALRVKLIYLPLYLRCL